VITVRSKNWRETFKRMGLSNTNVRQVASYVPLSGRAHRITNYPQSLTRQHTPALPDREARSANSLLDRPSTAYSPLVLERTINRWSDFDKLMEKGGQYASWAFRGQRDARWQMWTSLSRHLREFGVHPSVWPPQEARIVRIFKRKAHLHLTHIPVETDTFQWLALIQHYGGPTRLLDFTWSPYVAAFFALETATTDAAVFALDTRKLPQKISIGRVSATSLRETGAFEALFLPGTNQIVTQTEPGVLNPRLTAQLGTFVVPGVLDEPPEKVIDNCCGTDALVKITLSHDLREEAMRSLYDRNVHNASLFPDLNGLAASLRYELETHWAFDAKTGTDFPGWSGNPYARSLETSIDE
jgi:hypothetical protein